MEIAAMSGPLAVEMKVDLRQSGDCWQVVIEREGRRYDVGGIDELIRYLEWLAATGRPARGLR